MKETGKKIMIPILVFGCTLGMNVNADDAITELFSLLDKGGCEPTSLTGRTWSVSSSPADAHGALVSGDTLEFELTGNPNGIGKKGEIIIYRNGLLWNNEKGWVGECIRDGVISQYVVSGDVIIDGCPHELAIGRLDHDETMTNHIELVFHDSLEEAGGCQHSIMLHPGHAHGTED